MQVKKYRAATTREALEQIKQDLGDDAFVLETRQVKSGGFLGLGAQMQIEISAANPAREAKGFAASKTKQMSGQLNLMDDTVAVPLPAEKTKDNLMAALFNRKVETEKEKPALQSLPRYGSFLNLEQPAIETVEISTELPRIVHTKKPAPKPMAVEQIAATVSSTAPSSLENSTKAISNREFDLLRAELREVKFSLGMFSNRQNLQVVQDNVGLDMFSEILDPPFYDAFMQLTYTGISAELARKIVSEIIPQYKESSVKGSVKLSRLSHTALLQNISSLIKFEAHPLEQMKPTILASLGRQELEKRPRLPNSPPMLPCVNAAGWNSSHSTLTGLRRSNS